MIVAWGLARLAPVLAELSIERPLLVTSRRWSKLALPVSTRFEGVRAHASAEGVAEAVEEAGAGSADGLVALGGGSAIDTAKAVSAEFGLPVVSIPTTYSGAEWTVFFGVRNEADGVKTAGTGAQVLAIIYDLELTLGLPRAESGGSALNALAHCAEALYVRGRNDQADDEALKGAALISRSLPRVLADGSDRAARRGLLEGAAHAGAAMASAGMGLGHAMAQALGGRFGLAHGALNAVCLPPALRFNSSVAAGALARFAHAMETEDAVRRTEELARLGGFTRLRELGVPRDALSDVAARAAERAGARANPRQASWKEITALYMSVW